MTSQAKQSRPAKPLTLSEVEVAVAELGGVSVFFDRDGKPLGDFFKVTRPLSLCDFADWLYGEEPVCPKAEEATILVERVSICQRVYWVLTYNGDMIGHPVYQHDWR